MAATAKSAESTEPSSTGSLQRRAWKDAVLAMASTAATYVFTGVCLGLGHAAGGYAFNRIVRGRVPSLPSGDNVIPMSGRKAM
jgi:hypothetical protein